MKRTVQNKAGGLQDGSVGKVQATQARGPESCKKSGGMYLQSQHSGEEMGGAPWGLMAASLAELEAPGQ